MKKKVHLIAIGGSAMHNLALALSENGFIVTGSDDEINEPSRSRLKRAGLLPDTVGWFPEKITEDLSAIILGMHAREDNPELLRAKHLGLKIFSYPEYIYESAKNKTRIVIGGSHGKTTITAMILHVLNLLNIEADYLVGAQLEGFNTMVRISDNAKYAVIEGDEYLSSPIDLRPKFHLYHPHIAVISGIAWDHINVFPTFENYVAQFEKFIKLIEPKGSLIFCEADETLNTICRTPLNPHISIFPYTVPQHDIDNGITSIVHEGRSIPIKIFGDHNLMNLNAARLVCGGIGISEANFYEAIQSFKGAAKRLELVLQTEHFSFFKDFAHSPSKLKATIGAVKKQFPSRRIIACMELHTFSSLNEEFLEHYKDTMSEADEAIVYFNPHTIAHKKLKPVTEEMVNKCFNRQDLKIYNNSTELTAYLKSQNYYNAVLLMMSSGNFDGIDFSELAKELIQ